jgi:hypothetical protein
VDDGKTIKRQEFTPEELEALRKTKLDPLVNENGEAALETDAKGKVRQPRDPNAMLNFLADTYKNSKFNDRGQLVLMRETSSENGKNIEWEIRAAITGEKKIAYMFHFKDLDTGEEQTLLHKDARDSVQSLIGKTNGPEVLADILTGKETRKYSPTFDTAVHANDVLERSLYFKYQGRTKTVTESAKYYSTGYAQRINPVNGTLLEQEVPSTFEAYQNKDREALEARLRAVFGRLPVDEQTHEEARTAIRELFAERFPEGLPTDRDQDEFIKAVCTDMTDAYLAPVKLRDTTLTLIYSTVSLPSWTAGSRQVSCSIGATLGNGGWATLINSAKGPLLINGQPPVPPPAIPEERLNLPMSGDEPNP